MKTIDFAKLSATYGVTELEFVDLMFDYLIENGLEQINKGKKKPENITYSHQKTCGGGYIGIALINYAKQVH